MINSSSSIQIPVDTFYKEVLLVGQQQQQQQDRLVLAQALRNDVIIPDFEAFRYNGLHILRVKEPITSANRIPCSKL